MAKTETLTDKLSVRLQKFGGLSDRKAKTVAKGLSRAALWKSDGVPEKLEVKLGKLGLSPRKAKELAKKLAPTVRAAIRGKVPSIRKTKAVVENEAMVDAINGVDDPELDKVAPRVNGYRVRIDLPTLDYRNTEKPDQLLRVVHGLTSYNTYLVAALKPGGAMIAVRKFNDDSFKLKFYPTMRVWDFTQEELKSIGAHDYLQREWYERMMFSYKEAEQVLARVKAREEAEKSLAKKVVDRLRGITMDTLAKAFQYLPTGYRSQKAVGY